MISQRQLTVLVSIATVTWALLLWAHGFSLTGAFFGPFSTVITVLAFVLLLYNKWAWHWPIVRLLTDRPFLPGTWRGELSSTWVNPATNQKLAPIECYLVIRQSYSTLDVRLFTKESSSVALSGSIVTDDAGLHTIFTVYRNSPSPLARNRSPIHLGGLALQVDRTEDVELRGEYWTDRNTQGELRFNDRRLGLAYNFDDAKNLFLVPETS